MNRMLLKIMYGGFGILLGAGTALSGSYGFPKEDQKIYDQAVSLQEKIDEAGFHGFNLKDYKVRFYNGSNDYVVWKDEVTKEKPVLTTFAGTTYEVEGEYQVVLPTLDNFSKLFDMLGAAENISEGSLSFEKNTYGEKEHTATLWHEAFHTYQWTKHEENTEHFLDGLDVEGGLEKIMEKDIDGKKDVVELLKEQAKLLKKAYYAQELLEKKNYLYTYFQLEDKRKELLSSQAVAVERFYETIEGSACYIESCAYLALEGKAAMEQSYIDKCEYSKGSGKYYKTGMLKCYLLSQISPGWNQEYTFEHSLNELLEKACR